MQQLQQNISTLNISSGASGASDSGLQTDIALAEIQSDGKLLAERYIELTDCQDRSHGDFLYSFVPTVGEYELRMPYTGKYEYPGCFERYSGPEPEDDPIAGDGYWFSDLYWSFIDEVTTPRNCKRCYDDIAYGEFYDDEMCAKCLHDVYKVDIRECITCCDVNYIGENGKCIVCDYKEE